MILVVHVVVVVVVCAVIWWLSSIGDKCESFTLTTDRHTYYSQHGEDQYIYNKYFSTIQNGVFFEAGAMDGVQYSNTKFFEDALGWKGILVEPNPVNYAKLMTNRGTNSQNKLYNALISSSKEPVEFKFCPEIHSAVSCVVSTQPKEHDAKFFQHVPYEVVSLQPRTLTDIVRDSGFERIDFFSLDVEGHELEVMQSYDFSVPIRVLMVENLENNERDIQLRKLLESKGFVFAERFEINDIYINPHY